MISGNYDNNYDAKRTYEQIKDNFDKDLADVLDNADGVEKDGISEENFSIFTKAIILINQSENKENNADLLENMFSKYHWLKKALNIVGKKLKNIPKFEPIKIKLPKFKNYQIEKEQIMYDHLEMKTSGNILKKILSPDKIAKLKEALNNPEVESENFPSGLTPEDKEKLLQMLEDMEKKAQNTNE